ncbi:MAG: aspartate aminotransferase family protein [Promethearchaeota archaeon]
MSEEYGISSWPNTPEIYKKMENLVKIPMYPLKRSVMKKYLEYFEKKCKNSKNYITKAKELIPGGVQHNLAFNYPFPIAIRKAEGAYLWDIDDNKYIDFLQAGGPTLLGSNYKPVQEKVIEVIKECGPITGLFHEYEYKLAEIINHYMPSIEMFRMLGSGTESAMAAIRLARTFTDKRKIIKIGGAYHGWSDQLVYGLHIPGTGTFEAHGIPNGCSMDTQEVWPNDIDALKETLKKNEGEEGGTAAVLLEPLGPESGTRPVLKDYNKQVRELCDKHGTLLIFDEVVTAFRIGMGGCQGYFDIKPDLTIFGKIVAGGYPSAGGIGGRKDIMKFVAAGVEGIGKRAYVGGTLSANPLSCCSGYHAIKEIAEQKAYLKAGRAGDKITKGLQEIIEKYSLPYITWNHGSICHLETSGVMLIDIRKVDDLGQVLKEISARQHMMKEMGAAFMASGIITLAGSRLYTSMADNNKIIDDALQKFDKILSNTETPN